MPAKTKSVGDGDPHVLAACGVGHVVEVAVGVRIFIVDGRVDDAAVDREQRRDGLDRAGRAEQVTDHRLGAADRDLVCVVAEGDLQGLRLAGVVELGRGSVRVDVVDVLRLQARILESQHHRLRRRLAGLIGGDLVVGVVRGRVTQDLAVDAGSTIDRVLT